MKAGVAAYILALNLVLIQTTDLWGRPVLAAEMWLSENPTSARAAQFASQTYVAQGDARTALAILEGMLEQQPEDQHLALQSLHFCTHSPADMRRIERAEAVLAHANWIQNPVPFTLWSLASTPESDRCPALTRENLENLIRVARKAALRTQNDWALKRLLVAQAQLLYAHNNLKGALELLQEAYAVESDSNIVELVVYVMTSKGKDREATEFLQRAELQGPKNIAERFFYRRRLVEIKLTLTEESQ